MVRFMGQSFHAIGNIAKEFTEQGEERGKGQSPSLATKTMPCALYRFIELLNFIRWCV